MTLEQSWGAVWVAVFVIVLTFITILVLRMRRDSTRKTREANVDLMGKIAVGDQLFEYVNNWRVGYMRQAGGSMNLYYVLTGTALIATSLVTAVSALGGIFRDHTEALLIATTALGLIATVAQGLDRMLNDRKDFLRSGRYSTLLEIETVKFLDAYVQAKAATPATTIDPAARKTFVDAVVKIRANELADWIQDETSATVDLVGVAASVTAAEALGRAERDAFEADRAARAAATASDAANADAAAKDRARDTAQAAYDAAIQANADPTKPETQALAAQLEAAKRAAADAHTAADAKKAEAQRLQAIADQKHADLAKPAPPAQPPPAADPNNPTPAPDPNNPTPAPDPNNPTPAPDQNKK